MAGVCCKLSLSLFFLGIPSPIVKSKFLSLRNFFPWYGKEQLSCLSSSLKWERRGPCLMLTSTKASEKLYTVLLSLQQSFAWRKPGVCTALVLGKGKCIQAEKNVMYFFSAKGSGYRKRCEWLKFMLRQAARSSVSGSQLQPWPQRTFFPGSSVKIRYLLLCTEVYFMVKSRE